MAASVVVTVPLIVLVMLLQRKIIAGLQPEQSRADAGYHDFVAPGSRVEPGVSFAK